MITDNIKNASLYFGMNGRITAALNYLQVTDFSKMDPGKYEIEGTNIYVLVQHYNSKPIEKGLWEAHRQYIDIQYIVEGIERIGYANIESMNITQEYSPDGDYLLFEGGGDFIKVYPGCFVIFMPEDVHMPCIALSSSEPVKKVVMKVRI